MQGKRSLGLVPQHFQRTGSPGAGRSISSQTDFEHIQESSKRTKKTISVLWSAHRVPAGLNVWQPPCCLSVWAFYLNKISRGRQNVFPAKKRISIKSVRSKQIGTDRKKDRKKKVPEGNLATHVLASLVLIKNIPLGFSRTAASATLMLYVVRTHSHCNI